MNESIRQDMDNLDGHHDEGLDLRDLWRIGYSYKISVGLIFIFVMIITVYLTITMQPIFRASTVVMIKVSGIDPSSYVFDFGVSSSKQYMQNETEILNSYSLHNKVVQSLIDDGSAKELSLFGTRYIRKRYRLADYFLSWLGEVPDSVKVPIKMDETERIALVQSLRSSTITSIIRGTDAIKISVSSIDPGDAVLLTNRISKIYRNLDLAGGQGELHFVLTFLDEQINKYENRLARIEVELQQFQRQNQIYSLDGSVKLILNDLTLYEGIYYTNLAELEVAQGRVDYLKNQLSESEKVLMGEITNTNNPMIVALRGKIAELEAQKIQQMVDEGWLELSLQANDYNRRIMEMKSKLTELTESLILHGWSEEDPFSASQEIFNNIVEQEVEVHSARSRASEYKKLVDNVSQRLKTLPSQTLIYARLERELRLNENLYLTMKQKYEESRITEAGQRGKVTVLDPALIADKVRPDKKMNLAVGIFLGLAFGLGYVVVRELLDTTVKSVEQLERKGLTILGIIPDMRRNNSIQGRTHLQKTFERRDDLKRRLIIHEDPKSPVSENYRSLRTNIMYSFANKKIKSLLISSAQPGEGKSTSTANLAIAFAQLEKRTLLIDADLRKPVQHTVFDVSRGPGLSEYLIGDIQESGQIIRSTEIENLHIITAGGSPPNPSELLGSDRMGRLIEMLEQDWDMILLDSPPLVAVTDASMISSEIDAIAVVVKAAHTERSAVDRASKILSNVDAPLIGAILNGVNSDTIKGKYSYYQEYNYYHSDEN